MSKQELFCEKNGKLHTWHTILTGFAFLTTSIAWAIYDPYITKILNRLLTESIFITNLSAKLNEAFPVLAEFEKLRVRMLTLQVAELHLFHCSSVLL